MMKVLVLVGQLFIVLCWYELIVVDIMNLIWVMQIGDVVKLLCDIFFVFCEEEVCFIVIEEVGYMIGSLVNGYDQLYEEVIKLFDEIDCLMYMMIFVVCQVYGVYGQWLKNILFVVGRSF